MTVRTDPALYSTRCLGWSILFFLSITTFSCYIASVPFIQAEWSLSNVGTSVVFSSYLFGYAMSSLVCVPLSDRYTPGMMFLAGISAICLPNVLFPLIAEGFWSASFLRFVSGAGQVVAYTTGIRLVAHHYADRRGIAVSIFVALAYLGTTLSYVIMGMLLDRYADWRVSYLILSATASLSIVLCVIFLIGSRRGTRLTKAQVPRKSGRLEPRLLKDASIAKVIAAYAIHTADLYVVRLWLPLLLGAAFSYQGMGTSEAAAQASTWSGLMFMPGAGSVLLGGWLSDRWGRRSSAILILTLSALCSGLIGWLAAAPVFYVLAIGCFIGLLTAADSAIYSTTLIELSPEGKTGSIQALQSFIGFAAGAVIPVAVGSLIDLADDQIKWGMAFTLNALLSVVAILFLMTLTRAEKNEGGSKTCPA